MRRVSGLLALLLLAGVAIAQAVRVRGHLRSSNSSAESQPLLAPDPSPAEQLSAECKSMVLEKLSPVAQVESMECEEEKGFTRVAVEKLRVKDEKGTAAVIEQSLEVCSGISKECSEQLSPHMVLKMRFAGLAVSQPCADEMNQAQLDQDRMARSAVCEREGNYPQKTVEMLENRHMEGAISVVEKGLTECVKITGQHCAWQIAPVIVSQILTAVKQQSQQMPLLMSPANAAAVVVKAKTEKEFTPLSKLAVAHDDLLSNFTATTTTEAGVATVKLMQVKLLQTSEKSTRKMAPKKAAVKTQKTMNEQGLKDAMRHMMDDDDEDDIEGSSANTAFLQGEQGSDAYMEDSANSLSAALGPRWNSKELETTADQNTHALLQGIANPKALNGLNGMMKAMMSLR